MIMAGKKSVAATKKKRADEQSQMGKDKSPRKKKGDVDAHLLGHRAEIFKKGFGVQFRGNQVATGRVL
jgi:hypothetical protein